MNRPRRPSPAPLAAVALIAALAACGDTPTQITPLPRAIGEVQGVLIQVDNLAPLDPGTQGVYYAWSLLERNQAESLGAFFVDPATGELVDSNGAPITQFTSEDFAVRRTLRLLVTIELPGEAPEAPSGMQVLTGTFIDGVANLVVPISTAITEASGSVRIFTPTDGPRTNESSGVWAVDADGDPSLSIPDSTGALTYEMFIEVGGRTLNLGRFEAADDADNANQYSSDEFDAPEAPGEDLLENAPEGLTFPIDLSGARVTISLEGRTNDFVSRSQLVVLDAVLPVGLTGGEIVPLINRAAGTFPSGKAVLY